MQIKVTCQHISTNCNPMPNSIQFINHQFIAFSFNNQVGIYNLLSNKIIMNINYLPINAIRANCLSILKEINNNPYQILLAVGYDTGHLIIYQALLNSNESNYKIKQIIKQQSSLISINYNSKYLITNNNSGIIIEYQLREQFVQINRLVFPLNKLIQSIQLLIINDTIILFLGGVDQKIHTYKTKLNHQNYQYCFSLDGHQNGITKLCLTQEKQNQYLLASSSKDGYIRIWRITTDINLTKFHKNVKQLQINNFQYKILLESVLIGHECSVTSICWSNFRELELVSCSLDSTICIWGKDKQQNIWIVENRMGQFLGNKNAYFNVICNCVKQQKYLLGVNYIGSALIWKYNQQDDKFQLRQSFTGHSNKVNDIDWDHSGSFLVSVSQDQTTRIISKNITNNQYSQISRAQIHGYDINSVSTIKINSNTIDLIACGADQKVIRILQPPACFANYLNAYTQQNLHLFFNNVQQQKKYIKSKQGQTLLYQNYSEGGVQVLGLMTKVQKIQRENITNYYDEDEQQVNQIQQLDINKQQSSNINYNKPPHDDYLIKHTLWPQMNKLYGHPHEIQCLAHSNDGRYLASSCSALNKASASIIIWDILTWKIIKIIQYHTYTVYDICFSNNNKYLVSVSKDRKMALFNVEKDFEILWDLQCHTRAITSVSINHNNEIIATGSRDKLIKCHSIKDKITLCELVMNCSIYSLSFGSNNLLVCGCQNGSIFILQFNIENNSLNIKYEIPNNIGHSSSVNRIKWRNNNKYQQFGSCGDDHSVRIFKINEI